MLEQNSIIYEVKLTLEGTFKILEIIRLNVNLSKLEDM
jgi:hypothetical protein